MIRSPDETRHQELPTGQLTMLIFLESLKAEFPAPWSFVYTLPPEQKAFHRRRVHSIISRAKQKRNSLFSLLLFMAEDQIIFSSLEMDITAIYWYRRRACIKRISVEEHLNNEIQWHTPFPIPFASSSFNRSWMWWKKSSHDGQRRTFFLIFIQTAQSMRMVKTGFWAFHSSYGTRRDLHSFHFLHPRFEYELKLE